MHGISRRSVPDNGCEVNWWQGDLADNGWVQYVVEEAKPNILFHLGSHVAGARDISLVLPTFNSNLFSTVNLLTAAARVGCQRIILAGSMEEPDYGDEVSVPSSPYAAAKWAANAYARMFRELYGLSVYTARIFMVYGPGQMDLKKLIPYVILSLLNGKAPDLTSGHRQIDWVYVDDVVRGLMAMANSSEIGNARVDLGSGHFSTIKTVVEKLVNLINPEIIPQFGTLPERPLEQTRIARISDSKASIGWEPSISLDEGLASTVSWYQKQMQLGQL